MSVVWIVFVVPAILFVIFVAPIWLLLHYRSTRLTALVAQADLLQQRVHTLERLLDVESPGWRESATGGRDE